MSASKGKIEKEKKGVLYSVSCVFQFPKGITVRADTLRQTPETLASRTPAKIPKRGDIETPSRRQQPVLKPPRKLYTAATHTFSTLQLRYPVRIYARSAYTI